MFSCRLSEQAGCSVRVSPEIVAVYFSFFFKYLYLCTCVNVFVTMVPLSLTSRG